MVVIHLSLCILKSPGPSPPDDSGPDAARLMADAESQDEHRRESPPQPPVIPEVSELLPMNGMLTAV